MGATYVKIFTYSPQIMYFQCFDVHDYMITFDYCLVNFLVDPNILKI